MCPFIADAKEIASIDDTDVVITPAIGDFIKTGESDHVHFIVAPKGVGKTFLLKYKRNLYSRNNKGVYFIPKDYPIEGGHSLVALTYEKQELLGSYEKWVSLWKICISLSIIKNIINLYKPIGYEELESGLNGLIKRRPQPPEEVCVLIKDLGILSIYGILNNILMLKYNDLVKIIALDYQIEEIIKFVKYDVVTFIDNLDQRFEGYLRSNDTTNVNLKAVWFASHMGLIKAIDELSVINSSIKISASIRKEAFEKMKISTELGLQFIGETSDIQYTKKQLSDIFIHNIRGLEKNSLADPRYQQTNPIYAFLGLKDDKLISLGDQEENIFDYIYRHTLKRPRDYMIIGKYLKETDTAERIPDNIKRKVNEAAYEIAETFLTEIKPFSDIGDFNDVFDLIHKNILTEKDIRSICVTYNKKLGFKCKEYDCKKCMHSIHVFCDLYKFGLLGIVKYEEMYGKMIQEFLQIGDRVFESNILPHSEYYLIHPILNDHIKERNMYNRTEFAINDTVIIGDRLEWRDFASKRYCSLNKVVCESNKKINKEGVFLISSSEKLSLLTQLKIDLEKEFKNLGLSIEIEDWLKKDEPGTGRIFSNEICPKFFRNPRILAEVSDFNPNVFLNAVLQWA